MAESTVLMGTAKEGEVRATWRKEWLRISDATWIMMFSKKSMFVVHHRDGCQAYVFPTSNFDVLDGLFPHFK